MTVALFVFAIFLAAFHATAADQLNSKSLTVNVYSDGSATILQTLSANATTPQVTVQLLSSILSDVVVTDQNGSPLSFQISRSNITIYTIGSTGITLRYDTLNLTSKQGTVWRVDFTTAYNTTLVLPRLATLSYISGTPNSVSVQDQSPVATVSPGKWEFSYGVAIGVTTATTRNTSTSQSSGSTSNTSSSTGSTISTTNTLGLLAVSLAVVAALVILILWRRRRVDLGPQGANLRPDDVQVLNFISEKGGKVLEPEIRMRFALPKTSAWRQIKRLERLGYVKITKIGSQNQIELIKNRESGSS
ncbi:MAG: hypothetical protein OK422_01475 [Thaumarchaeota archaeon]|nr:hypothetical protein [Nitrososphaerota archaeon]